MVKKTAISSFLRDDFGVEDFVSGRALDNYNTISLEDVALSNALGLLSALSDRADTNTDTFAMAAESYLGESNSLGIIADSFIDKINSRFKTAVEISKMGVEGFNAFAYGMEDFGESVKGFFKAIGAAFKKMIQAVVNFMRQVANFIGSQFAKTQTKYYDRFTKDIKGKGGPDASKGKTIKCRGIIITSAKDLTDSFIKPVQNYIKLVNNIENDINNGVTGRINKLTETSHTELSGDGSITSEGYGDLTFKNKKGDSIRIDKVKKPSDIGQALVFGSNRVKEIKAGAFLKENESAIELLSKPGLEGMKAYNKVGQDVIKNLNKALKSVDKASTELYKDFKANYNSMSKDEKEGFKEEKKEAKNELKARRKIMREISLMRNTSGKLTGILFSSYSSLLKARSYLASAVKNYGVKESKTAKKLNEAYETAGASA